MTVSLEVPIEMLDKGVSSQTTDQIFEQAQTRITKYAFNGGDEFDGSPTFDWEIVAQNVNATNAYDIVLLDDTLNIVSTITVPANTAITKYKNTGLEGVFLASTGVKLLLKGTASLDDVRCYCSRVLVGQTNATKTMVSIPLINHEGHIFANSINAPVDSTSSTSYIQPVPDSYSIWLRNDADFDAFQADDTPAADDRPFVFGVTLVKTLGVGGDTIYASLFNRTDNAQVTASEVSTTSTAVVALHAEVSSSATNFHYHAAPNGDEHEVRIKASGTDGAACNILQARLRIRLASLTECEVYYRFVRNHRKPLFGNVTADEQRILYDSSKFDSPTVYHESTGNDVSNPVAATIEMRDDDTNDTGIAGGSNVSGASIDFTGTTKERIRTSAITPDSGDRFIFRTEGASFQVVLSVSSWLVVHCETGVAPPASAFIPQVIQF